MKKLYMIVSTDEFELPEYVADTISELSRMSGVNYINIVKTLYLKRKGICKKSKYVEVEVGDNDM